MCSAAETKYVRQNVTAANPSPAFNVPVAAVQYLNANGLATGRAAGYAAPSNAKRPRRSNAISLQTIVLTFSVLMCVFSCLLTVLLTYKWHTDTNRQVDRLVDTVHARVQTVLLDLNALTEIVRTELASKRLNVGPTSKDNGGGDDSIKDYEDDVDDNDENRFMGKELLENSWPTKSSSPYRSNERSNTSDDRRRRRRRRAAEIGPIKTKNDLNGSNNPKSDVELIEENNEENTMRTYNRRKPKKIGVGKKKPVEEQEEEDTDEDIKDMPEIVAAHFTSDSSKYNTKTHMHYHGNGRLKHPDGDYRDWSQKLWDINLNSENLNQNNFQMKNGRVEIIKPGLYFVYAQIFYSDTHDINGYYIMQNNEQMFGCTTTRHQNNQSDSCYTGGLMNLNSKDIISIRGLDEERYIILDPVKSFFGLFKVSKTNKR